jgi:hypothetical protein
VSERLSERVDPEVVGQFGVPGGDVPRDAFLVAEMGEQAERRRQALFAVANVGGDGMRRSAMNWTVTRSGPGEGG